jgi:hypothetical protein
MTNPSSTCHSHRVQRLSHHVALVAALLTPLTLVVIAPAAALAAARAPQAAASICDNVKASAVAAVVGHTVPAPTAATDNIKPTKQNFGISAVSTTCIYGSENSLAALKNDVLLALEVTSRPLTQAEWTKGLSQGGLAKDYSKYKGLGIPAWYFKDTQDGVTTQGIVGIVGTHLYSAALYTPGSVMPELAALVGLARKL